MIIKVRSYSGFKADEKPLSFSIGDRTLKVEEVLDNWYGEGHEYFKLRAEDGYVYIIRHDTGRDEWELIMTEKTEK